MQEIYQAFMRTTMSQYKYMCVYNYRACRPMTKRVKN